MAKNKNNAPKNKNKNSSTSSKNTSQTTSQAVKNSHAEIPDDSPRRSGPGGN